MGKALVFLYDFGYDRDTKKWCNWGYLKRFLESDPLPVAFKEPGRKPRVEASDVASCACSLLRFLMKIAAGALFTMIQRPGDCIHFQQSPAQIPQVAIFASL